MKFSDDQIREAMEGFINSKADTEFERMRDALGSITPVKKTRRGVITEIDGVIYPSMKAAAEAHGMSPRTVQNMIDRGSFSTFGLGKGAGRAMVVECNGIRYKTVGQFARAHGLNHREISNKITRFMRDGYDEIKTPVGALKVIGKLKDLGWSKEDEH